jgi:putative salt-induced outer membrane protein YdiY
VRLEGEDMKIVSASGEERDIQRNQVISFAAGEPKEVDYWSAKVSLGANIQRGNIDEIDLSTRATIRRRSAYSNFYFQYLGEFSETNGIQTTNNQRITSYFDRFLTREFFWRIVNIEYYQDPFQNIANRTTIGSSLGWKIWDTERFKWDVAGGPAYQYISFDTVEAGESDQEANLATTISTNFEYKINKKVSLIGNYSVFYAGRKVGGYTLHSDTTLETEFLGRLDFDISFIWDYQSDPVSEVTGEVPQNSDFQIVFSLGLDL